MKRGEMQKKNFRFLDRLPYFPFYRTIVLNVQKMCKKCARKSNKTHIEHICMFEVGCIQIFNFLSYRSAEKETVQNIDFSDCYTAVQMFWIKYKADDLNFTKKGFT